MVLRFSKVQLWFKENILGKTSSIRFVYWSICGWPVLYKLAWFRSNSTWHAICWPVCASCFLRFPIPNTYTQSCTQNREIETWAEVRVCVWKCGHIIVYGIPTNYTKKARRVAAKTAWSVWPSSDWISHSRRYVGWIFRRYIYIYICISWCNY